MTWTNDHTCQRSRTDRKEGHHAAVERFAIQYLTRFGVGTVEPIQTAYQFKVVKGQNAPFLK
jgi:hypothetical protein